MSKKSSSSQTTAQTDNRQVNTSTNTTTNTSTINNTSTSSLSLGDRAIMAGDGSTVLVTDGGAMAQAVELANTLGGQSFRTASGVVTDAFSFGTDLAEMFGQRQAATSTAAMDVADSAITAVRGAGSDALRAVEASQSGAFDFGRALASVFGNQINTSTDRALSTADAALSSAAAGVREVTGRAFDLVDASASREVGFLANVLKTNQAQTDQITNLVADAYNDAKGRGAQTDTMLMVAIGGALLVAFLAIRKG